MAYCINIGLYVATKNVKNVEMFKVIVLNLQTKKATYWGRVNVAAKESRIQELLVERTEAKHHVNFQEPLNKFLRARMIAGIDSELFHKKLTTNLKFESIIYRHLNRLSNHFHIEFLN